MLTLSYFSYKGGSGRSSLAYNTLPLLAEKLGATEKEPIIVLDLDIDSAGLTLLFQDEADKKVNALSVFDVLKEEIPGSTLSPDEKPISMHPFFSRLVPIGKALGHEEDHNKAILFVPAQQGKVLDGSIGNYNSSGNPLNALVELCYDYNCKAVIFDTPAGDQLTAQWSLDCSDKIAVCMRITHQFRIGTAKFLQLVSGKYSNKEFVIVPNAVPTEDIVVEGVPFNYDGARSDIIRRIQDILPKNKVNFNMLEDGFLGVSEVKSFKVRENVLYKFEQLTEDEDKAYKCYHRFASIISE